MMDPVIRRNDVPPVSCGCSLQVRGERCRQSARRLKALHEKGRARQTYWSYQVWHEQDEEPNVSQDEEEPNQGDHVRRKPYWQQFGGPVPLFSQHMTILAGGVLQYAYVSKGDEGGWSWYGQRGGAGLFRFFGFGGRGMCIQSMRRHVRMVVERSRRRATCQRQSIYTT